ncbi:MAG TPA: hypothetical protein VFI74_04295 [Candidatus Saccharimonadales bacterium]|nr:hypothetical protein [Candidatus Saccharimonadales bacterium]
MKYDAQVNAALEAAPSFDFIDHSIVPEAILNPTAFSIPPEANDDYPIVFPTREQLVRPDYSIYVGSPRKIRKVMDAYARHPLYGGSPHYTELPREEERMEAVQRLGGSALYAVSFFRNERYQGGHGMTTHFLHLAVYDWETTKLGYAAHRAFPLMPSIDDKAEIRSLGYVSREHVLRTAQEQDPPLFPKLKRPLGAKVLDTLRRHVF